MDEKISVEEEPEMPLRYKFCFVLEFKQDLISVWAGWLAYIFSNFSVFIVDSKYIKIYRLSFFLGDLFLS
jgi:hypothetical protein